MNYLVQSIFQRKQALDFEQSVQVEVYKIYFENKEFDYEMCYILQFRLSLQRPAIWLSRTWKYVTTKKIIPASLAGWDRPGKNKEKAVSAEEKMKRDRRKGTYSLFFNTRSISSDPSS